MHNVAIDVDEHFLFLHTIIELFSVFVSFSIFVQAWITYSTHRIKSQYFIGLVFFAVACFDLVHTFTYKGMPFYDDEHAAARATWFWLLARFTESVGLALFIFRPTQLFVYNRIKGLAVTLTTVIILTAVVMYSPDKLPVLIDDNGVTTLKVIIEYVISSLFLITFITLLIRYIREARGIREHLLMMFALFTAMIGELFFTIYAHVYAVENLLGHVFKFFAFVYLYRSIYFPEIKKIMVEKERAIQHQLEAEQKLNEIEKSLATQVFEAHEDERKRVSRELHDSIGQSLFSILVTLNTVNDQQSHEQNTETIKVVKEMTQQAMLEVKDIARSLRPSALDDLGFVAAIRAYIESYEHIHHIHVNFEMQGSIRRLDPDIETALYRICQEALTNTAKYAQATEVSLALIPSDNSLQLLIEDNGIGFNADEYLAQTNRRGIGLFSINERAEGVGGQAQISSHINEGTKITVVMPMQYE